MLRDQLNLQNALAALGIKDAQHAHFTIEAQNTETLDFKATEFDTMITYLHEAIAAGKALTLNVLWDGGSDYFDLSPHSKKADQFLIDLLALQGWQVIG